VPALEGLDPVMLVQGKEVQGTSKSPQPAADSSIFLRTRKTKLLLRKIRERYEIQLDGACARMGPGVEADPDLYTVYKGHIYAFGSDNCLKMFKAAPEKFVEAQPITTGASATPEALRQGQALIEKAVAALGGDKKLDGTQELSGTRKVHHNVASRTRQNKSHHCLSGSHSPGNHQAIRYVGECCNLR
jgi:YHS domain-containing protein